MNTLLQIGTDAEFFVAKEGKISSAIGFIGGSKKEPRVVPLGNLQEDNVLAEFAIDPVKNKQGFVQNIHHVVGELASVVREHSLDLVLKSSHFYEKEELLAFPPAAMEMGCDPDFNVYARRQNERPSAFTRLRTAAAHVHFSYPCPDDERTMQIIKALDYTLGLWSVVEDNDVDRRALYGKAGSCRIKMYGGEYRTLGNFWLRDDESIEFVYDMTKACVEHTEEILRECEIVLSEERLINIIDTCDKEQARIMHPVIMHVINKYLSKEEADVKLSA